MPNSRPSGAAWACAPEVFPTWAWLLARWRARRGLRGRRGRRKTAAAEAAAEAAAAEAAADGEAAADTAADAAAAVSVSPPPRVL